MARTGWFARDFHVPLQRASDAVRRLMRRPYSSDEDRRRVTGVREWPPDVTVGSDVMVGFLGETGCDANIDLEYRRKRPLTYLHVFPYSDRLGTDATRVRHQVPVRSSASGAARYAPSAQS